MATTIDSSSYGAALAQLAAALAFEFPAVSTDDVHAFLASPRVARCLDAFYRGERALGGGRPARGAAAGAWEETMTPSDRPRLLDGSLPSTAATACRAFDVVPSVLLFGALSGLGGSDLAAQAPDPFVPGGLLQEPALFHGSAMLCLAWAADTEEGGTEAGSVQRAASAMLETATPGIHFLVRLVPARVGIDDANAPLHIVSGLVASAIPAERGSDAGAAGGGGLPHDAGTGATSLSAAAATLLHESHRETAGGRAAEGAGGGAWNRVVRASAGLATVQGFKDVLELVYVPAVGGARGWASEQADALRAELVACAGALNELSSDMAAVLGAALRFAAQLSPIAHTAVHESAHDVVVRLAQQLEREASTGDAPWEYVLDRQGPTSVRRQWHARAASLQGAAAATRWILASAAGRAAVARCDAQDEGPALRLLEALRGAEAEAAVAAERARLLQACEPSWAPLSAADLDVVEAAVPAAVAAVRSLASQSSHFASPDNATTLLRRISLRVRASCARALRSVVQGAASSSDAPAAPSTAQHGSGDDAGGAGLGGGCTFLRLPPREAIPALRHVLRVHQALKAAVRAETRTGRLQVAEAGALEPMLALAERCARLIEVFDARARLARSAGGELSVRRAEMVVSEELEAWASRDYDMLWPSLGDPVLQAWQALREGSGAAGSAVDTLSGPEWAQLPVSARAVLEVVAPGGPGSDGPVAGPATGRSMASSSAQAAAQTHAHMLRAAAAGAARGVDRRALARQAPDMAAFESDCRRFLVGAMGEADRLVVAALEARVKAAPSVMTALDVLQCVLKEGAGGPGPGSRLQLRPALRSAVDSQLLALMHHYAADLRRLRAHYDAGRESPPLARGAPPLAGRVLWVRHLRRRAEGPMTAMVARCGLAPGIVPVLAAAAEEFTRSLRQRTAAFLTASAGVRTTADDLSGATGGALARQVRERAEARRAYLDPNPESLRTEVASALRSSQHADGAGDTRRMGMLDEADVLARLEAQQEALAAMRSEDAAALAEAAFAEATLALSPHDAALLQPVGQRRGGEARVGSDQEEAAAWVGEEGIVALSLRWLDEEDAAGVLAEMGLGASASIAGGGRTASSHIHQHLSSRAAHAAQTGSDSALIAAAVSRSAEVRPQESARGSWRAGGTHGAPATSSAAALAMARRPVLQRPFGLRVCREYRRLDEALAAYEEACLKEWRKQAYRASDALRATVLVLPPDGGAGESALRVGDSAFPLPRVNLDPLVPRLLRETRAVGRQLGLTPPPGAAPAMQGVHALETLAARLKRALDGREAALRSVHPLFAALTPLLTRPVEEAVRACLVEVTWASMQLSTAVARVERRVDTMQRAVTAAGAVLLRTIQPALSSLRAINLYDEQSRRPALAPAPAPGSTSGVGEVASDDDGAGGGSVATQDEVASTATVGTASTRGRDHSSGGGPTLAGTWARAHLHHVSACRRRLAEQAMQVRRGVQELLAALEEAVTAAPAAEVGRARSQIVAGFDRMVEDAVVAACVSGLQALLRRAQSSLNLSFLPVLTPLFRLDVELAIPNVRVSPALATVQSAVVRVARAMLRTAGAVPARHDDALEWDSLHRPGESRALPDRTRAEQAGEEEEEEEARHPEQPAHVSLLESSQMEGEHAPAGTGEEGEGGGVDGTGVAALLQASLARESGRRRRIRSLFPAVADRRDVLVGALRLAGAVTRLQGRVADTLRGYARFEFLWQDATDDPVQMRLASHAHTTQRALHRRVQEERDTAAAVAAHPDPSESDGEEWGADTARWLGAGVSEAFPAPKARGQARQRQETRQEEELLDTLEERVREGTEAEALPVALATYEDQFHMLSRVDADVDGSPPVHVVGCLCLDAHPLKRSLALEAARRRETVAASLELWVATDTLRLRTGLRALQWLLARPLRSTQDLRRAMRALEALAKVEDAFMHRMRRLQEAMDLHAHCRAPTLRAMSDVREELLARRESELITSTADMREVAELFAAARAAARQCRECVRVQRPKLVGVVMQGAEELRQRVDAMWAQWRGPQSPNDPALSLDEARERLHGFQQGLEEVEGALKEQRQDQALLQVDSDPAPRLSRLAAEVQVTNQVLSLASDVEEAIVSRDASQFRALDVQSHEAALSALHARLRALPEAAKALAAYAPLSTSVLDALAMLPLLRALTHLSVTLDHWRRVASLVGVSPEDLAPGSPVFRLTSLAGLHEAREDILRVCDEARREHEAAETIHRFRARWEACTLPITSSTKPAGLIIDEEAADNILADLHESQLVLRALASSPTFAVLAAPRQSAGSGDRPSDMAAQLGKWLETLRQCDSVVTQWLEVQRQWQFLDAVFSRNDEVGKALPQAAARFASVGRAWSRLMTGAARRPSLVPLCTEDAAVQGTVPQLTRQLEGCSAALTGFLDQKRVRLPLLCFVSDSDVVDLLGGAEDAAEATRQAGKLFPWLSLLDVAREAPDRITAVVTDGGETVTLPDDEEVRVGAPVDEWLPALHRSVRRGVRRALLAAAKRLASALPLDGPAYQDSSGDRARSSAAAEAASPARTPAAGTAAALFPTSVSLHLAANAEEGRRRTRGRHPQSDPSAGGGSMSPRTVELAARRRWDSPAARCARECVRPDFLASTLGATAEQVARLCLAQHASHCLAAAGGGVRHAWSDLRAVSRAVATDLAHTLCRPLPAPLRAKAESVAAIVLAHRDLCTDLAEQRVAWSDAFQWTRHLRLQWAAEAIDALPASVLHVHARGRSKAAREVAAVRAARGKRSGGGGRGGDGAAAAHAAGLPLAERHRGSQAGANLLDGAAPAAPAQRAAASMTSPGGASLGEEGQSEDVDDSDNGEGSREVGSAQRELEEEAHSALMTAEVATARLPVGHDLHPRRDGAILAPPTDRSVLALALAVRDGAFGCVFGEAGSGKTELVRGFGRVLGRQTVVTRASPATQSSLLAHLLGGALSSGAWLVLDDLNQLRASVLAATATYLRSFAEAVAQGGGVAHLGGKRWRVRPDATVLATLSPAGSGAGGSRAPLPPSTARQFRPVAVSKPDVALLCSLRLGAAGFRHARTLGRRIAAVVESFCSQEGGGGSQPGKCTLEPLRLASGMAHAMVRDRTAALRSAWMGVARAEEEGAAGNARHPPRTTEGLSRALHTLGVPGVKESAQGVAQATGPVHARSLSPAPRFAKAHSASWVGEGSLTPIATGGQRVRRIGSGRESPRSPKRLALSRKAGSGRGRGNRARSWRATPVASLTLAREEADSAADAARAKEEEAEEALEREEEERQAALEAEVARMERQEMGQTDPGDSVGLRSSARDDWYEDTPGEREREKRPQQGSAAVRRRQAQACRRFVPTAAAPFNWAPPSSLLKRRAGGEASVHAPTAQAWTQVLDAAGGWVWDEEGADGEFPGPDARTAALRALPAPLHPFVHPEVADAWERRLLCQHCRRVLAPRAGTATGQAFDAVAAASLGVSIAEWSGDDASTEGSADAGEDTEVQLAIRDALQAPHSEAEARRRERLRQHLAAATEREGFTASSAWLDKGCEVLDASNSHGALLLVGPAHSGKSTLLRVVAAATAGEQAKHAEALDDLRRTIAAVAGSAVTAASEREGGPRGRARALSEQSSLSESEPTWVREALDSAEVAEEEEETTTSDSASESVGSAGPELLSPTPDTADKSRVARNIGILRAASFLAIAGRRRFSSRDVTAGQRPPPVATGSGPAWASTDVIQLGRRGSEVGDGSGPSGAPASRQSWARQDSVEGSLSVGTGASQEEVAAQDEAVRVEGTVVVVFPSAVSSLEALYGHTDAASGRWRDGVLSEVLRVLNAHAVEEETSARYLGRLGGELAEEERGAEHSGAASAGGGDGQEAVGTGGPSAWLVLDGPVRPEWAEAVEPLLEPGGSLAVGGQEHVARAASLRVVLETGSLTHASPSTLSRCGVVRAGGGGAGPVGWRDVADHWLRLALQRHRRERAAVSLAVQRASVHTATEHRRRTAQGTEGERKGRDEPVAPGVAPSATEAAAAAEAAALAAPHLAFGTSTGMDGLRAKASLAILASAPLLRGVTPLGLMPLHVLADDGLGGGASAADMGGMGVGGGEGGSEAVPLLTDTQLVLVHWLLAAHLPAALRCMAAVSSRSRAMSRASELFGVGGQDEAEGISADGGQLADLPEPATALVGRVLTLLSATLSGLPVDPDFVASEAPAEEAEVARLAAEARKSGAGRGRGAGREDAPAPSVPDAWASVRDRAVARARDSLLLRSTEHAVAFAIAWGLGGSLPAKQRRLFEALLRRAQPSLPPLEDASRVGGIAQLVRRVGKAQRAAVDASVTCAMLTSPEAAAALHERDTSAVARQSADAVWDKYRQAVWSFTHPLPPWPEEGSERVPALTLPTGGLSVFHAFVAGDGRWRAHADALAAVHTAPEAAGLRRVGLPAALSPAVAAAWGAGDSLQWGHHIPAGPIAGLAALDEVCVVPTARDRAALLLASLASREDRPVALVGERAGVGVSTLARRWAHAGRAAAQRVQLACRPLSQHDRLQTFGSAGLHLPGALTHPGGGSKGGAAREAGFGRLATGADPTVVSAGLAGAPRAAGAVYRCFAGDGTGLRHWLCGHLQPALSRQLGPRKGDVLCAVVDDLHMADAAPLGGRTAGEVLRQIADKGGCFSSTRGGAGWAAVHGVRLMLTFGGGGREEDAGEYARLCARSQVIHVPAHSGATLRSVLRSHVISALDSRGPFPAQVLRAAGELACASERVWRSLGEAVPLTGSGLQQGLLSLHGCWRLARTVLAADARVVDTAPALVALWRHEARRAWAGYAESMRAAGVLEPAVAQDKVDAIAASLDTTGQADGQPRITVTSGVVPLAGAAVQSQPWLAACVAMPEAATEHVTDTLRRLQQELVEDLDAALATPATPDTAEEKASSAPSPRRAPRGSPSGRRRRVGRSRARTSTPPPPSPSGSASSSDAPGWAGKGGVAASRDDVAATPTTPAAERPPSHSAEWWWHRWRALRQCQGLVDRVWQRAAEDARRARGVDQGHAPKEEEIWVGEVESQAGRGPSARRVPPSLPPALSSGDAEVLGRLEELVLRPLADELPAVATPAAPGEIDASPGHELQGLAAWRECLAPAPEDGDDVVASGVQRLEAAVAALSVRSEDALAQRARGGVLAAWAELARAQGAESDSTEPHSLFAQPYAPHSADSVMRALVTAVAEGDLEVAGNGVAQRAGFSSHEELARHLAGGTADPGAAALSRMLVEAGVDAGAAQSLAQCPALVHALAERPAPPAALNIAVHPGVARAVAAAARSIAHHGCHVVLVGAAGGGKASVARLMARALRARVVELGVPLEEDGGEGGPSARDRTRLGDGNGQGEDTGALGQHHTAGGSGIEPSLLPASWARALYVAARRAALLSERSLLLLPHAAATMPGAVARLLHAVTASEGPLTALLEPHARHALRAEVQAQLSDAAAAVEAPSEGTSAPAAAPAASGDDPLMAEVRELSQDSTLVDELIAQRLRRHLRVVVCARDIGPLRACAERCPGVLARVQVVPVPGWTSPAAAAAVAAHELQCLGWDDAASAAVREASSALLGDRPARAAMGRLLRAAAASARGGRWDREPPAPPLTEAKPDLQRMMDTMPSASAMAVALAATHAAWRKKNGADSEDVGSADEPVAVAGRATMPAAPGPEGAGQVVQRDSWSGAPRSLPALVRAFTHLFRRDVARAMAFLRKLSAGLGALDRARSAVKGIEGDMERRKDAVAESEERLSVERGRARRQRETGSREWQEVAASRARIKATARQLELELASINQELMAVLPALRSAEEALGRVRSDDIRALRTMSKPPRLIQRVFDGVLIVLHLPLDPVRLEEGEEGRRGLLVPSWEKAMRHLLLDPMLVSRLMAFPRDRANEETAELLQPYINSGEFEYDRALHSSGSVAGLCLWLRGLAAYATAVRVVKPKQKLAREKEAALARERAALAQAEAALQETQEAARAAAFRLEAAEVRKRAARQALERMAPLLQSTRALVDTLGPEAEGWRRRARAATERLPVLVGDAVLSASALVLGEGGEAAARSALQSHSIAFSDGEGGSAIGRLIGTSAQRAWAMAGMPCDPKFLTAAAALLACLPSTGRSLAVPRPPWSQGAGEGGDGEAWTAPVPPMHEVPLGTVPGRMPLLWDPHQQGARFLRLALRDGEVAVVPQWAACDAEQFGARVRDAAARGQVLFIPDCDQLPSHALVLVLALQRDAAGCARGDDDGGVKASSVLDRLLTRRFHALAALRGTGEEGRGSASAATALDLGPSAHSGAGGGTGWGAFQGSLVTATGRSQLHRQASLGEKREARAERERRRAGLAPIRGVRDPAQRLAARSAALIAPVADPAGEDELAWVDGAAERGQGKPGQSPAAAALRAAAPEGSGGSVKERTGKSAGGDRAGPRASASDRDSGGILQRVHAVARSGGGGQATGVTFAEDYGRGESESRRLRVGGHSVRVAPGFAVVLGTEDGSALQLAQHGGTNSARCGLLGAMLAGCWPVDFAPTHEALASRGALEAAAAVSPAVHARCLRAMVGLAQSSARRESAEASLLSALQQASEDKKIGSDAELAQRVLEMTRAARHAEEEESAAQGGLDAAKQQCSAFQGIGARAATLFEAVQWVREGQPARATFRVQHWLAALRTALQRRRSSADGAEWAADDMTALVESASAAVMECARAAVPCSREPEILLYAALAVCARERKRSLLPALIVLARRPCAEGALSGYAAVLELLRAQNAVAAAAAASAGQRAGSAAAFLKWVARARAARRPLPRSLIGVVGAGEWEALCEVCATDPALEALPAAVDASGGGGTWAPLLHGAAPEEGPIGVPASGGSARRLPAGSVAHLAIVLALRPDRAPAACLHFARRVLGEAVVPYARMPLRLAIQASTYPLTPLVVQGGGASAPLVHVLRQVDSLRDSPVEAVDVGEGGEAAALRRVRAAARFGRCLVVRGCQLASGTFLLSVEQLLASSFLDQAALLTVKSARASEAAAANTTMRLAAGSRASKRTGPLHGRQTPQGHRRLSQPTPPRTSSPALRRQRSTPLWRRGRSLRVSGPVAQASSSSLRVRPESAEIGAGGHTHGHRSSSAIGHAHARGSMTEAEEGRAASGAGGGLKALLQRAARRITALTGVGTRLAEACASEWAGPCGNAAPGEEGSLPTPADAAAPSDTGTPAPAASIRVHPGFQLVLEFDSGGVDWSAHADRQSRQAANGAVVLPPALARRSRVLAAPPPQGVREQLVRSWEALPDRALFALEHPYWRPSLYALTVAHAILAERARLGSAGLAAAGAPGPRQLRAAANQLRAVVSGCAMNAAPGWDAVRELVAAAGYPEVGAHPRDAVALRRVLHRVLDGRVCVPGFELAPGHAVPVFSTREAYVEHAGRLPARAVEAATALGVPTSAVRESEERVARAVVARLAPGGGALAAGRGVRPPPGGDGALTTQPGATDRMSDLLVAVLTALANAPQGDEPALREALSLSGGTLAAGGTPLASRLAALSRCAAGEAAAARALRRQAWVDLVHCLRACAGPERAWAAVQALPHAAEVVWSTLGRAAPSSLVLGPGAGSSDKAGSAPEPPTASPPVLLSWLVRGAAPPSWRPRGVGPAALGAWVPWIHRACAQAEAWRALCALGPGPGLPAALSLPHLVLPELALREVGDAAVALAPLVHAAKAAAAAGQPVETSVRHAAVAGDPLEGRRRLVLRPVARAGKQGAAVGEAPSLRMLLHGARISAGWWDAGAALLRTAPSRAQEGGSGASFAEGDVSLELVAFADREAARWATRPEVPRQQMLRLPLRVSEGSGDGLPTSVVVFAEEADEWALGGATVTVAPVGRGSEGASDRRAKQERE